MWSIAQRLCFWMRDLLLSLVKELLIPVRSVIVAYKMIASASALLAARYITLITHQLIIHSCLFYDMKSLKLLNVVFFFLEHFYHSELMSHSSDKLFLYVFGNWINRLQEHLKASRREWSIHRLSQRIQATIQV